MSQSTQQFIPIREIRNDVVILKNGELRSVLLCASINFELKGADEQTAIIMQYQNFLNSLDFSVQLYAQSRRLDIRPYIVRIEERLREQTNELLKVQTPEYIQFIKTFTELNNVMSKSFFAIIPYAPAIGISKRGFFSDLFGKKSQAVKTEEDSVHFRADKAALEQRRDVVLSGLSRILITGAQLTPQQLIELYYKIFNPGELGQVVSPSLRA